MSSGRWGTQMIFSYFRLNVTHTTSSDLVVSSSWTPSWQEFWVWLIYLTNLSLDTNFKLAPGCTEQKWSQRDQHCLIRCNQNISPCNLLEHYAISRTLTYLQPWSAKKTNIPVGIDPSGWHKMANPVGEACSARVASSLGTVIEVSMGTSMGASLAATCSSEEVESAGGCAVKFSQTFIFENREFTEQPLQQVEKAGYEVIMLTIDTAQVGRRLSEIRNRS